TPILTWNPPADILVGTALGPNQLNATANVAGVFVYSPRAGSVLYRGVGQPLSANFTPNDINNYLGATVTVPLTVFNRPRALGQSRQPDGRFQIDVLTE